MKLFRGTKKECEILINDIIQDIISKTSPKEELTIAIPGGRSVSGIFNLLKNNTNIKWDKTHIFLVDERYVPLNHEDSNYKLAHDTFLKDLISSKKIREENIHPFKIEEGIKKYEEELKKIKNYFDIVLLSSGEDSHIAGLYPHHTINDESDYFLYMNDSPKPPSKRITASRKLIERSQHALLVFFGENKREALTKFLQNTNIEDAPHKIIENCPNTYIFTDLK